MLEKDIKDVDASLELLIDRQERVKKTSIIIMSFGVFYAIVGLCIYFSKLYVLGCIVACSGFTIVIMGTILITQYNYYNILIMFKQKEK